ncbi:MAG TPA: enoyl-CoA hydratase-related protein [Nocardioidaceae bacterium]|nr:enoyl-CoA hydratase-related protein [Nocardioidaceae bacterium]
MTDPAAPVQYAVADGVATITLNRPEAMNALDLTTKEALKSAVEQAGTDPAARVVVVTGSGKAFCVGQDLREHITNISTRSMEEVWSTVPEHYAPIAAGLAGMDKPVIAAVNGVAAGAGASIAFLCDFRVVADTAGFNTAFTGIGLSCDTGASWTLPRLVGPDKALELLMMPRTVSAAEALELGLATRVVPAAELDAEVSALAATLSQGPTVAYGAVRRAVGFAATHTLTESLAFEGDMMARTGSSADHQNAVQSFIAKEQPRFEGH